MPKRVKHRHNSGFKQLIVKHLSDNINIYFKVFTIFIIGILIGIIVVNNLPQTELQRINEYISNSINALKNNTEISKVQILKSSLFKNIIIVSVIWFLGLTLIGSFILYFLTLIIGITFGYSLAVIMTHFTVIQGMLFLFTDMLLQNIIYIPTIIFLIVQGIKSQKNLSTKQDSPKYIVAKHSACSIGSMIMLIFASLIEAYISSKLIFLIVQYL